jgi:hypothetical protein
MDTWARGRREPQRTDKGRHFFRARAIWNGILAYYDYRISTGPLEGTNNKIKTIIEYQRWNSSVILFLLTIAMYLATLIGWSIIN